MAHLSVDLHRAICVVVQTGDDLDERRLAGTVVPEDAGDLALTGRDVDTPKGMYVAVALADVVELEDGSVGGAVRSSDVVVDGDRAHRESAFRLTYWLTRVAPISMTPRKVLSQSTSHLA